MTLSLEYNRHFIRYGDRLDTEESLIDVGCIASGSAKIIDNPVCE